MASIDRRMGEVVPIDNDLCFVLQRLNRRLSRRINAALKDLGLTAEQAVMLDGIDALVCPRYNALHVKLGLDHSTVSANIRPLLQRSLIASFIDPTDRRAKRLQLTEQGRKSLDASRLILMEIDFFLKSKLEDRSSHSGLVSSLRLLAQEPPFGKPQKSPG